MRRPGRRAHARKLQLRGSSPNQRARKNGGRRECGSTNDILIAKDAPPLPAVEPGKVGGVMDKPPAGHNSGVLIFRPGKEVAAMFEEAILDPDPFWDQVAIDRVLKKNNALQLIDPRFHCMFYVRSWRIFRAVFGRNWIYHSLHGKSKLALISRLLALQGR